ncbi:MAG: OmpH family outer membrane protein [Lentisphaeria bacterium]|nr:OmpH family outer membrane protein [Lentisphaeria bacterium]
MKTAKIMAAAALCLLVPFVASGSERIAVVDLEKVFREYYKSRIAEDTIRSQGETYRGYLVQLNDRREKLRTEARIAIRNSQNVALAAEERLKARQQAAKLEATLKELDTEIELYQENMIKAMRELERVKRAEIVADIEKCVRKRAAAEGYLYVFDSSGKTMNEQPALMMFPASCDLTQVVIEDLNRTAVKTFPAPPPVTK